MSGLIEWLKGRSEESIIERTLDHMKKALECVVELRKGFIFLVEEKRADLATSTFERVDHLEHEADIIRHEILNKLAKSKISPSIREALIHLIKRIDNVANTANRVGRRLRLIEAVTINELPQEVAVKMLEMSRKSVETAKLTLSMVRELSEGDYENLEPMEEKIGAVEHEVDLLYLGVWQKLVTLNGESNGKILRNPFVAIQLKESLDALEMITDACEDVADFVILISLSRLQ